MFTISRFQEILKYLPRSTFNRLVKEHESDKHSKGFGSWSQLVAMLYGQLGGASSLRTLIAGFNSQCHHYHLGVKPLRRSTPSSQSRRIGLIIGTIYASGNAVILSSGE